MSPVRLSRSPDLQRLRDEGYEVCATDLGHLVVDNVPYVNSLSQVARARIVSKLTMAGEVTTNPVTDHVVFWTGEPPCDAYGTALPNMVNPGQAPLEPDLVATCSFSCKPSTPYADYHAKMTIYVAMVSGPAQEIDPEVTAQTYRVAQDEDAGSPFVYPDTASSQARISALMERFESQRVAIIGLGGTGAHILDHVAKTRIQEIHLFDGDDFLSHNAFRSPGAASLEELNTKPKKVDRLRAVYSVMKHGIVAHPYPISEANVEELRGFDFVFLSMEGGTIKRRIVDNLTEWGMSFIDVGMGLKIGGGSLMGVLRVTTSTPAKRDHVDGCVDFSEPGPDDVYDENIQVSDLNCLNAVLAVVKWKKLMGIYADLEHEHFTAYTLDGNFITNEDLLP
jgi:molybdopterin/thiamine biosynthesis adenylyltransferase